MILPSKSILSEQTDNSHRLPRGLFSIGKASKYLGVSIDTLRNWEESGKIAPIRTSGGMRKYRLSQLQKLVELNPKLTSKATNLLFTIDNPKPILTTPRRSLKPNSFNILGFAGPVLILTLFFMVAGISLPNVLETQTSFNKQLAGDLNSFQQFISKPSFTISSVGSSAITEDSLVSADKLLNNPVNHLLARGINPKDTYTNVLGISTEAANEAQDGLGRAVNLIVATISSLFQPQESTDGSKLVALDMSVLTRRFNALEKYVKELEKKLTAGSKTTQNYQILASTNPVTSVKTLEPGTSFTDLIGNTIIDSYGNLYPTSGIQASLGTTTNPYYSLNLNNFSVNSDGHLYANGLVDLGNESTDTINIVGTINSNIIPTTTNSYTLGNDSHYFSNAFLTAASIGTLSVTSCTGCAAAAVPEADTLATVTARGATTSTALTLSSATNNITVGTLTATGGTINGTTIGATSASSGSFTSLANSGAYTQSGTTANSFTGTSTFSNATYSALFTGGNVGIGTTTPTGLFHVKITPTLSATGGTITTSGTYTIHTFTTSGTFTPNSSGNVEVLVVGGGGAGRGNGAAGNSGDGGSAGQYVYNASFAVTSGNKTVTIGSGGTGVANAAGGNGQNSVFDSITATGGTGGQTTSSSGPIAGGTGAGGAGGAGSGSVAGSGGVGLSNSISGSAVYYAGGGGGGLTTGGAGGNGGGGRGEDYTAGNAAAGSANSGGGGGGVSNAGTTAGKNGGSGIVIIRYLTPANADALVVNSTGKVGIGTATPGAVFDVNATCTSFQATHQCTDYAEIYPASEDTEFGDVVTIDQVASPDKIVKKANSPYDHKILGIVSTNPAVLVEGEHVTLMQGSDYRLDPRKPAIALAGRVPTKVSTENGNIEVGDYLTSSSVPGVAMKSTRPGPTIGKALKGFDGSSSEGQTVISSSSGSREVQLGKILTFVNVSYADPGNVLANLTLDNDGTLIVPKLNEAISKIATDSANLRNDVDELKLKLTSPDILLATDSSTLANLTVSDTTSTLKLATLDATISGTLKSLGDTFLGNTTIAGNFSVDGTLAFTGNSLSSIGTLFLQNGPLADLIDLFNGKVTIDSTGKLATNSLAISSTTLGDTVITAGQTTVNLSNTQVTATSKIFITPTSNLEGNLIVESIRPGDGFTIKLTKPNTSDVKFNWWLVEQKN